MMISGLTIAGFMFIMAFFDIFGNFDDPTRWIGNVMWLIMGIAAGVILTLVYIYVTMSGGMYLPMMAIFSITFYISSYFVSAYAMTSIA